MNGQTSVKGQSTVLFCLLINSQSQLFRLHPIRINILNSLRKPMFKGKNFVYEFYVWHDYGFV